jgi:hypothetical protein
MNAYVLWNATVCRGCSRVFDFLKFVTWIWRCGLRIWNSIDDLNVCASDLGSWPVTRDRSFRYRGRNRWQRSPERHTPSMHRTRVTKVKGDKKNRKLEGGIIIIMTTRSRLSWTRT